MRINLGCGKSILPGFFNIDAQANPDGKSPDLVFALSFNRNGDLVEKIPLDDGCADILQAMHIIEHMQAWEAPAFLAECKRLLEPGGKLILELPNIRLACENLLAGLPDQMGMWPIYGDWNHKDPYMMHRHGYTPKTIEALLLSAEFNNICHLPPQTHGARANRDMRVECVK
jgi:predicted SAM-dependent methyltransferase